MRPEWHETARKEWRRIGLRNAVEELCRRPWGRRLSTSGTAGSAAGRGRDAGSERLE